MEFYLSFNQLVEGNMMAIFLPVFLLVIVLEGVVIFRQQGTYPWKNASVSACMTFGHSTQALSRGLIFGIIAAGANSVRLTTIPVSIGSWWTLIPLFLLADLGFYVEHRCSHRVQLLWASHSVHHSSEKMLAKRRSAYLGRQCCRVYFCSTCQLCGLATNLFGSNGMVSANLTYQFFVHTEVVPRIGGLEWFINTPSAHRVHHASNPEYLDKNYGGETAHLGSSIWLVSIGETRHFDPLWAGSSSLIAKQPVRYRL